MPRTSNSQNKILGIILLVVGVGLLYWGYQMSQALTSQLSSSLTGAMPNAVMWRYIIGAACSLVGLFLLVRR